MNMSLYELYVWLSELDFPSLSAIWTWLITVPWWLAILTVVFTVYAFRITFHFLNWLFEWMFEAGFEAGGLLRKWIEAARWYKSKTYEFGKSIKRIFFP
jgi:hypothetical protein